MLRGYPMTPAIQHPTVGAVVNHELGRRGALPGYVAIGNDLGGETGYLATQYGPFSTGNTPDSGTIEVRDLRLPNNISVEEFEHRQRIRDVVNKTFRRIEADPAPLDTLDAYYKQAYEMMSSDEVRGAFDLSQESDKTKERYGLKKFAQYGGQAGMRMLLARRLVEAGARFITLRYGSWDDHTNIKNSYELQMPAFDQAFSTLIKDLEERGLLDSTLVWVTSEFGRTP